jgi:ABC-type sugar transport system substrate-binding protein
MSVMGVGGSAGWASLMMRGVNKAGSASGATASGAGSDLEAVRKDGLLTFAKNAKKEAWLEKLRQWREEAMKSLGLTEEKLASMAPEARTKALQQVEDAVQRKIQDALETAREEGKRKGDQGGQVNVPQFVDLSV